MSTMITEVYEAEDRDKVRIHFAIIESNFPDEALLRD